ncbi:MAG: HEAT repeat domain-containing protein [Planctomycetes bacterium]|nr:HEAT repeat domain-containing protein [Planctomycetota bacterium]
MPTRRTLAAALLAALALAAASAAEAARAGAPADAPPDVDPYTYLVTYELAKGMSRAPLTAIEDAVRDADDPGRRAVEAKLLAAMADPKATYGCKQFVCRMLRRCGSEACVPALAALLTDKDLSHMARFALQALPAEKAGEALRAALGKTEGDLRIGVISSLGFRRDAAAVPALSKFAGGADEAAASAAITALGQIGTAEAARALESLTAPKPLAAAWADALLACADRMAGAGDKAAAGAIYRRMADEGRPTFVRVAAIRGLVLVDGEKAIPAVLPLIRSSDAALSQAVGGFIAEMPGEGVGRALADQLPDLPPGARTIVLGALEARGDRACAPAAAAALASDDAGVRVAAARALAVIGGPAQVEPLIKAALADGEAAQAADDALARLSADGVGEAIMRLAEADHPAIRAKAIEVAAARRDEKAVPAALAATGDADPAVRLAAIKALGALGGPAELPALVRLLVSAAADEERRALVDAVARTAGRAGGDAGAAPIAEALEKASPQAKVALLAVLQQTGGAKALEAVKGQLASDNADVAKAAVRALADWPDPAPMDTLKDIAKSDTSASNRVLALRGFVRMASMPGKRPAAESVRMLGEALAMAERPEEKRMVLGALPALARPEALALAEACRGDAALAAEADKAASRIRAALVSSKLKVTAGSNPRAAGKAVDGNPGTRWDTGHPMKPGDWFAMDFQMLVTVKAITLDHEPSGNDWPRDYEVYVSDDGKDWKGPVVTGKGTTDGTTIRFPQPVRTQHVKIVQTGKTDKWHWSIHEMKVEME